MIRLIASDIDGTLVPDGAPSINPEYYEVITALQQKGIIFCPCSGRSYQSMHTLFAPIADSLYFISENGTILRTEEKILYTWPVPQEYIRPLVEEGRKLPGISVMICTPDKTYCECGEDGALYRLMHDDYHYNIENIPDVLAVPFDQILKVSLFHNDDQIEEVCKPLTDSEWSTKVQMLCAGTKWLECVALNAGKGEAFALLLELLRLADSTDRCERLFTAESWGRMGFLQLLTDASGKRLVDWDSGECYFDTPYFISILEAVMQLPEQAVEPEDYYSEQHSLVDGEGLLTLSEYGDLWQGANAGKQYGEGNWTIVGLPELGSVIKPYSTLGASALGMAADSQHKEECWAFLRTFYLNPRPYAFSAMQGGLEESIQGQLQQREQEGLMGKWLNAEADMRAFADAFTGATVLYRHDDAVWEIVQAEASRYFAGQVSAEDCAKVIQSRARIYISEQGG